MIATLDTFRNTLEDLGGELGVTVYRRRHVDAEVAEFHGSRSSRPPSQVPEGMTTEGKGGMILVEGLLVNQYIQFDRIDFEGFANADPAEGCGT
jgi:hypothetical protein